MKIKKLIKFVPFFFYGLLLAFVLFELFYFLKLRSFKVSESDFKVEFSPEVYIQGLVDSMSLEEKVGRLFIIGFNGVSVSSTDKSFFSDYNFSNFLVLGKNIKSIETTLLLTSSLRNLSSSSFPGLIAVDQEGGAVSRLSFLENASVSQNEIFSYDQAFSTAFKRGSQLSSLGFNVNLSPCLEVVRDNSSFIARSGRAFLGDEGQVFLLGQAMTSGYNSSGVISVLKHFPGGLGRVRQDPHLTLPILDVGADEVFKDLLPFKKLIDAGQVKALMITHLIYPAVDADFPVSLSENFTSFILRRDLGFEGVVITDDLLMKSIADNFEIEFAVEKAFQAGADMFIISSDKEKQVKAYNALLKAVKEGRISELRLNASLKRILSLTSKNN